MSLPSGYTQLEYIQSSGTQYINTGFKPNQDTKISMTADFPPSRNTWLYGGRASAGSNSLGFLYTSGDKYRFDYASSLNELTTKPTGKFTIDSDKNKCYINGELAVTATYTTFTSPVNMYIFGNNNNGSLSGGSSAKLYNCSIYDNGVLIRSFVPCKNASGTVGLYDSVNNQFYQNAGTGSFVAGAEVKGSHKTLIDGTGYNLKAGRCLVGGTAYSVKKGRVLVNGTGYDIPFSSGIPLSTVALGDILMLNENGNTVPFYVCKHDYESGLNGAGRTLLVRKDCYDKRAFSSNDNAFSGSSMDTWLNNTWLKLLDADIQAAISKTKFYYTPGNHNNTVSTLQRAVFLLSVTEMGKSSGYANTEGTALASAVCSQIAIAYRNGSAVTQWTRTPYTFNSVTVYYLSTNGSIDADFCGNSNGSRPAFTLPGTFPVIQNPDGTYTIAA